MTLVGCFDLIMRFFEAFIGNPSFREKVIGYGLIVLKVALGAYMLKTVAIGLLTLAGMYALPILFAVAMSALLYAIADRYSEDLKNSLISIKDKLVESIQNLIPAIAEGVLEAVKFAINSAKSFLFKEVFDVSIVRTAGKFLEDVGTGTLNLLEKGAKTVEGAFAEGGTTTIAGNYLVGERGAEIVELPAGAKVHNNSETNRLLSTPSNTVNNTHHNNITVNVEAKGNSDAELRMLADKIGKLVAGNINRRVSSSSSIMR